MKSSVWRIVVFIGVFLSSLSFVLAQTPSSTGAPHADFATHYPGDQAGIMIQSADWLPINATTPSKTRAKHGFAASLSYGAVPASVVAEYDGQHAQVQISAGQPVICICHLISLPGDAVIVKLHPKKASRELDGGRMRVLPVVGGSKMADANQSDLIPADVSQPEKMVWLVRPQQPLPAGEYALMLGTQNVSIFPFTVTASSTESAPSPGK